MDRCGRPKRWWGCAIAVAALALGVALAPPARATLKYGPIELSGSVDSQSLFRSAEIDNWQFIQNRNTALLRLDYDWLQNGKLIERFDTPWLKRSKLYILYRGVYDGFYGIAPGGAQKGMSEFDDKIGGPIIGNSIGATTTACPPGSPNPCPVNGVYSHLNSEGRNALAWENTLREAYVDMTFADIPLSLRLGRQQVIWGESDQFRLMDIVNPLDLTWHLQQEDWDKIRIPLWLIKGIWDFGDVWGFSNVFAEGIYNPGDFQPGVKVEYLPAPWSVPVPNPVRSGQIQLASPTQPILLSPVFDLHGTSFRQGDFTRGPAEASAGGIRLHGVTDIPFIDMQGVELTANYYVGRDLGIGAVAGGPFGLDIKNVTIPGTLIPANAVKQDPNNPNSPPASFSGRPVFPAFVDAKFVHPYSNIFGMTGNWFEGNYTNTVFRLEMAYQIDAPFQTAQIHSRAPVLQNGEPVPGVFAPLGLTKRDVWAGMIGFDRPTWIKWLNPRTTWFITGQFFWSQVIGTAGNLRGPILSAGEKPYFTPRNNLTLPANLRSNGVGRWDNGPFAGQTERTQDSTFLPGSTDDLRQTELLATLAATSFYLGGTVVPFAAIAIDPINRNLLCQLKLDYFITNNLILQLRENFYNDLGSGELSFDPWGAGGLNARRDETGVKVTYQF